ncbi:conserved hypothetical protein [Altererythrobacter sp. B11]|uniref:hypothetical protein n=1 Tax=Altererythrobacter sp. B11 TaxID=2060312 RepID=UPI000DC7013F|nr:hypothetical protein [Altererythrobacter sp. B11]BBC72546.1 conserved hypothetical protein [Altererythrobacter sp. B11]
MIARLFAALGAIAGPCLALLVAVPAAAQPQPAPIPCERACMEQMAGQFLDALAARDSSRLPLAEDARYTENGQAMGFDNGMWQTASKVGAYRHVFADPESGQFGVFSTMDENGHGLTLGARVKLHLGQISEVELVTYRTGAGPAWNDAGYAYLEKLKTPKALWMDEPKPAQRLTRQELVAAANNYFSAIENNDGKGYYPFTEDCDRLENGMLTTNNPGIVKMGGVDIGGMGCKAQFSTGLYGVVTEVHDRRFPIVDVERQAVMGFAVFDHCGCKRELTTPDGQKVAVSMFNKPSSILLAEAFKLKGGQIQQVEAVGTSVPYHSDPGWSR